MTIVIDAYNVLHCTHILAGPDALMDIDRLCRLLGRSRWAGWRIVVVCDGVPPPLADRESAEVELVYVGAGRDADSWIERFIAQCDHPRDLTVVSNDQRLIRAARRRRCRCLDSESFLRQLVSRPARPGRGEKPTGQNPDETARWLEQFGYTESQHQPGRSSTPPHLPPGPDDLTEGGADSTEHWMRLFGFEDEPPSD